VAYVSFERVRERLVVHARQAGRPQMSTDDRALHVLAGHEECLDAAVLNPSITAEFDAFDEAFDDDLALE
ncbi:MAG: hypothetical protein QF681_19545, partial [Vicinamibacterales bacterium]|nr:hypothetical protein [Vicinamibacterales bacterium]